MVRFLKQSTATVQDQGPFVDITDGVTTEESLTLAAGEHYVIKNGGAAAQRNDSTVPTHRHKGIYSLDLDATDTNTLGGLTVVTDNSAAHKNYEYFHVIPANVYDALFGANAAFDGSGRVDVGSWLGQAVTLSGNNNPNVNIEEISDNTSVPAVLEAALGAPLAVTFTGTPSTTAMAVSTSGASSNDDWYNGRLLFIATGSAAGQLTDITDYTGSSKQFTVTEVATAPSSGDTAVIF